MPAILSAGLITIDIDGPHVTVDIALTTLGLNATLPAQLTQYTGSSDRKPIQNIHKLKL